MTSSELARPLPDFHGFGYKIAQIENNTHCNYKCWFCPNAYDTPAPKECMSLDLFKKILSEIRSVYQPWELNDILIRSSSVRLTGTLCVRLLGNNINSPRFMGNIKVALLNVLYFSVCSDTSL